MTAVTERGLKLDKALRALQGANDAFYQRVVIGDVKGALERGVFVNMEIENVIKVMTGTEIK